MTQEELEYTKIYIPQISNEPYLPNHLNAIVRDLESRTIHEGRIVPQEYIRHDCIRTMFSLIRLQCLYNVNEEIYPRFLLEIFSSAEIVSNSQCCKNRESLDGRSTTL